MDQLKALALEEAIAHWKRLATGNRKLGEGVGPSDCPLCSLYWKQEARGSAEGPRVWCNGCPVFERTGQEACRGTPYEAVSDAMDKDDSFMDTPEFMELAERELEFLESLRTTTERKEDE